MSEAEKILADIYNEYYYEGAESHFPCGEIAEYFSQRGIYKDKEWDCYHCEKEEIKND